MPEAFDPYHRWLGIPPEKQPPNHYVLLAIEPFEDSPDVISSAADQRMAHLRTFQTGKHAKVSQKLLNEVAAARVCLLDPEKKATYDLQLGLKLEDEAAKEETARRASLQQAMPLQDVPVPVGPPPPATSATAPVGPSEPSAGGAAKLWTEHQMKVIAAAGACVVLMVILVAWPSSPPEKATLAVNWAEEQRDGAKLEIDGLPVALGGGPIERVVEPGEHRLVATRPGCEPFEWTGAVEAGASRSVEPTWRPLQPPPTESVAKADDDRPPPESPSPDPAEPPPDSPDEPPLQPPVVVEAPAATANPAEPEPDGPATEPTAVAQDPPKVEAPRPAPGKPPMPSAEAQAAVLEQLEEAYQVSQAKTDEARLKLARELFDLGRKARNLDERFVLLRKAMELSQEGGDAELMLKMIDAIAADFDVDPWQVKQNMLAKFAGGARDSKEIGSLVKASAVFIGKAQAAKRYDLALGAATLAYRTCQQSTGRAYRKETYDRRQEVEELYEQQQKLEAALAAVEADPDDGPANLFLAKLYCFSQGDWQRGLPHLVKCTDTSLKAAAEQELAAPSDPNQQIDLADTWYDLAQAAKDDTKDALLLHAGTWYLRAQSKLTSVLAKAKVTKRLEEIRQVGEPPVYVERHVATTGPTEGISGGTRAPSPSVPDLEIPVVPDSPELPAVAGRTLDPANVQTLAILQAGYTVNSLAFMPDGRTLVSAGSGRVAFWDATTGRLLKELPRFPDNELTVDVDAKGSLLAVANGDNTASLWDASSGQLRATLSGHGKLIKDIALSPDGSLVATASDDKSVGLWEVGPGQLRKMINDFKNEMYVVTFSPDGRLLASGSRGEGVDLWNAATGEIHMRLEGSKTTVRCIAFSRDGSLLASGGRNNLVLLFDVATGKHLRTFTGHTQHVESVAFSPDGSVLASSGNDWTVRFWDVASGELRRTLTDHTNAVGAVAFSPDGSLLASASRDGTIRLWGTDPRKRPSPGPTNPTLPPKRDGLADLLNARSGTPVARPAQVESFDPATAELLLTFPPDSERAVSLAFTPDGKTLMAAYKKKYGVRFFDPHTSRLQRMMPPPQGEIRRAALSPDGSLLAVATSEKIIGLWNTAKGRFLGQLAGHTEGIRRVVFSPDGSLLASCSDDGTVRLWDTKAVRPLKVLQGHNEYVRGLDFSPDGTVLASMGERGSLILWDLPSGKQRRSLPLDGKRGAVSLAFSPDGSSLATGHDTFVLLWDLSTGTSRRTKGGHSTGTGVAFHPAGSVVGSNSREVQFWDAKTGEMLRKIDTGGSMVNSIAFSPDGSMFAFSGEEVPLQIWGHKSGGSASAAPAPSPTLPTAAAEPADGSEAVFDVKSSVPFLRQAKRGLAVKVFASGNNGHTIHLNGMPLMKCGRDKPSAAAAMLKEGDVLAVKLGDRFDIMSIWMLFQTAQGEYLFETSEKWNAYLPADPAQWWNVRNIRPGVQKAVYVEDRREYVNLVQAAAQQAVPNLPKARPITSEISGPSKRGDSYLYYVVTVEDLLPKSRRGE